MCLAVRDIGGVTSAVDAADVFLLQEVITSSVL
jgi:hypothetical protein